jgi:Carboxypeptidase regulatory-like domain/TonB dependent receptor
MPCHFPFPRSAATTLLVCLLSALLAAQTAKHSVAPSSRLIVSVVDENGVAVPSARVFLTQDPKNQPRRCETDFAGRCTFPDLVPAAYQIRVEKPGFYLLTNQTVDSNATSNLDVKLFHQQEIREVVNVVESPPAIDPAQTAATEQLTGLNIVNIPYPSTRDYRNVLNFIPGTIQDLTGQPHILGSETYQTLTLLDGFNVSQPANGLLLVRVSTDSIRSIDVESSRIPAEQGKGSGGVLSINTGIGSDKFHFSGTNFIPSAQFRKGLNFDSVDPRFAISGPIRKGKIWFFDSPEGEYDNNIVRELPNGADRDPFWRLGNLAKLQVNLTPRNILTTSYLINRQREARTGLSILNPAPTTSVSKLSADIANVKDQHYFGGGELLELGFGFNTYGSEQIPLGTLPYVVTPEGTQGNFYLFSHTRARRLQWLANLYLAPTQWHGKHEVKLGVDFDRLTHHPVFDRRDISFLREGAVLPAGQTCFSITASPCTRFSLFTPHAETELHNTESSAFIEDRWSPNEHLLIEPGLRFDWDQIVRHSLVSPRLAATYILDRDAHTKLSAGIGIFYDSTNLDLVATPHEGQRTDFFFDANGNLTAGPVPITFSEDRNHLRAPRFLNWSLGVEQKLPAEVYLKAEYIQRHGTGGFVYEAIGNAPVSSNFFLSNTRQDHYDAFQITARHTFKKTYLVTGAYTRSRARTNRALDFNVDSPLLSPQLPGPFPWDAPNRFLAWGLLPLLKNLDLAYSAEARSGFPFNVINEQQQLVEPPGSRRLPTYFSLNLFLEKRFHLFHRYWAVRGGFNNITGRSNPGFVNNDISSPGFLKFSGVGRRTFTTRIRFIGR